MDTIQILLDDVRRMRLSVARNSRSIVGKRLRRAALQGAFRSCGTKLSIGPGATILFPERISIGDRLNTSPGIILAASEEGTLSIGSDCSFNAHSQFLAGPRGSIAIGDGVLVGPNAIIRNCDHAWRDVSRPIREQGHVCRDLVIEDNVWIAANAVVLGGATIRSGSVIAAGAVVRRGEYGPHALIAGNPAAVVHTLTDGDRR